MFVSIADCDVVGAKWETMEDFDAELLNPSSKLDRALVRACKKTVAILLLAARETLYNEMAVQDYITATYEDVR